MKKIVLNQSRTLILGLLAVSVISCSDSEKSNNQFFQGKDISSYASIKAEKGTKEAGINILQNGSWELYAGKDAPTIDFENAVLKGNSPGYKNLNHTDYQQYCLVWSDGSRATFATRQLPMEGQVNFRDLGGYKTKDGKYVKWGMVFRSGKCNSLTESDLDYLASIPLKTIIDFRSDEEKSSEPDKVPSSVTNEIHYPINPGNLSGIDISEAIQKGDVEACKQYLIDGNEQFVLNFQEEYKAFFENLMAGNKTPLMFHCTAGKDRAGFASAMFLAALGVDRETIVKDYLLTNEMTGVTLESMKEIYGDNDMAVCMYYISSVQSEYINKAFTTIEKEYGSVENYLTTQLNVDVAKMKKLYLY